MHGFIMRTIFCRPGSLRCATKTLRTLLNTRAEARRKKHGHSMADIPPAEKKPLRTTINQARRLIRIVVGFTVLLIGLAMVVLPGPAVVVIPIGLAILATEFVWAKRLMKRFTDGAKSIKKKYTPGR